MKLKPQADWIKATEWVDRVETALLQATPPGHTFPNVLIRLTNAEFTALVEARRITQGQVH